jgi:hypothetical protein
MSTVDLNPIYQQVVNPFIQDILEGLALAVVTWATYLVKKYAPTFMASWLESKASTDLNTALANGVQVALHQVENAEQAYSNVEVKGMVQRYAVQYAVDHAPGAINHFGLNPDQLAIKALAYIPTPQMQIASAVSPSEVVVKPLPPAT